MKADYTLQNLSLLSLDELRDHWRKRFSTAPPAYQSRLLLLHAFAYQMQAREHGGLSAGRKRHLTALAQKFSADPRYVHTPAEALQPGTVLIRDWHGKRYGVTVAEDGFIYDGALYTSLTKVAQAITGTKRSGPLFFKQTETNASRAATP